MRNSSSYLILSLLFPDKSATKSYMLSLLDKSINIHLILYRLVRKGLLEKIDDLYFLTIHGKAIVLSTVLGINLLQLNGLSIIYFYYNKGKASSNIPLPATKNDILSILTLLYVKKNVRYIWYEIRQLVRLGICKSLSPQLLILEDTYYNMLECKGYDKILKDIYIDLYQRAVKNGLSIDKC